MADHAHGHGHEPAFHATTKDYVIGFVLSVILTAIPFWLVMTGALPTNRPPPHHHRLCRGAGRGPHGLLPAHERQDRGRLEPAGALFTILLVAIILSGTLWVMFHLNTNMMPVKMDGMG
jgi:cytochrome o ubiquinol oxidase operon protein cyoD